MLGVVWSRGGWRRSSPSLALGRRARVGRLGLIATRARLGRRRRRAAAAWSRLGLGGTLLVVAGGLLRTRPARSIFAFADAPNPFPASFGFHEVFHVLVITAVACHYTAVAFFAVS